MLDRRLRLPVAGFSMRYVPQHLGPWSVWRSLTLKRAGQFKGFAHHSLVGVYTGVSKGQTVISPEEGSSIFLRNTGIHLSIVTKRPITWTVTPVELCHM